MPEKFTYNSIQFESNGAKTRKYTVKIHNGKGTKTVQNMKNGRTIGKKTIKLSRKEIKNIKNRKFMPGLFKPCIMACKY
jgi:hypothetical protein